MCLHVVVTLILLAIDIHAHTHTDKKKREKIKKKSTSGEYKVRKTTKKTNNHDILLHVHTYAQNGRTSTNADWRARTHIYYYEKKVHQ